MIKSETNIAAQKCRNVPNWRTRRTIKNVLYEYVFSNFFVNNTVSLSLLVEPAAVFTVYFTIYIPIEGRQHPHKV